MRRDILYKSAGTTAGSCLTFFDVADDSRGVACSIRMEQWISCDTYRLVAPQAESLLDTQPNWKADDASREIQFKAASTSYLATLSREVWYSSS
jgi:hypothetical protein